MSKRAAIIGAGVGGLGAAVRLRLKGYEVEVYEAALHPGGKMAEIEAGGYRFDAGPSLFTMPHLVDDLFRAAGDDPRQYFNYTTLEEACRYFWEDGTVLSAKTDADAFGQEAERVLGVPARRITHYLNASAEAYDIAGELFLGRSLHKLETYTRWETLKAALLAPTLNLFGSLHSTNARRLKHPKLVQLFDRYATYNGSDPYQAPGILRMIPHLEHNIGAAFPHGGMAEIPKSIHRLGERLGVRYHFGTPVERILLDGKQAKGIRANGQELPFDVVVSNMDIVPTYRRLMPEAPAPETTLAQERSSSALIFYWGIQTEFPGLSLHNILFSEDYREEFDQIFRRLVPPTDPTIYIHISSKMEPADAPPGGENWFVMVNVPADNGQDWPALIPALRRRVLAKLTRMLGRDIEPLIVTEDTLTPQLIEQRTSSFRGALYGTSSNAQTAAFFRHPNFSRRLKDVYFVGGSVHPGGGIPLSLNSAKIVSELLPADSHEHA